MSFFSQNDINEIFAKQGQKLTPPLNEANSEESTYFLYMSYLKQVVTALLRTNFDQAVDVICDFGKTFSFECEQHKGDADAVWWGSNRDATSYKDYIGLAFEAISHKNTRAIYAIFPCVRFKLDQRHPMFFDDFLALEEIQGNLNEYLGVCAEKETKQGVFERYDAECKESPSLSKGYIYTDFDGVILKRPKYSFDDGTLNIKRIEADFNCCVETGDMRDFLVSMRNTYYQSRNDQPEFFFYYACALMLDFSMTQNIFFWNGYLSREICRLTVLLSRTLDSSSQSHYEAKMEHYLDAMVRLVSNIVKSIESFRTESAAQISLFRIGEFLINLSYIFPFYNGAIETLASFNEHPLLEGEGFSSLSYILSHEALVWMMRRDGKDPFSDTDSATQSSAPYSTSELMAADNEEKSPTLPDKENSSGCLASLCAFAFLPLVSLVASILFAI